MRRIKEVVNALTHFVEKKEVLREDIGEYYDIAFFSDIMDDLVDVVREHQKQGDHSGANEMARILIYLHLSVLWYFKERRYARQNWPTLITTEKVSG